MSYYHPIRARQRSIWLYNHIIRSRGSFLKFARRQLRRKIMCSKGITKITFKEFLRANIKSHWLRICLGPDTQEACMLCGEVFRETDLIKPVRCSRPGCPGIYCLQCFTDLQNLCTICLEPIQYGDLSDISEEKDSSEGEEKKRKKKRKKFKCKISKCLKKKESDDDSENENFRFKEEDYLLPPTNPSDSDYESEFDTENSYTYQQTKSLTDDKPNLYDTKFRDLEKQGIPDYASWDDSRNETTLPLRKNLSLGSLSTSSDDFEIILPSMKRPQKDTKSITDFSSSTGESQHTLEPENVHIDFDARVKYNVIKEPKKSTNTSIQTTNSTSNVESPISSTSSNIDYVDFNSNIDDKQTILKSNQEIIRKRTEFKSLERKKRLEEIMNSSRYKRESSSDKSTFASSNITLPSKSSDSSLSSIRSYVHNDKRYQEKVKSYYKHVNKSFTNISLTQPHPKHNNVINFIKNLFKKNKNREDSYPLKELNNSKKLLYCSLFSDNELCNRSVPPSTRSTETSLMGSAESFAQKTADKSKRQTPTVSEKPESFSSSDSEISDLDVYFRTTLASDSEHLPSPKAKKSPDLKLNKYITTSPPELIEQTPRFSREPPERDFCDTPIMSENSDSNEFVDSPKFSDFDKQIVMNKSRCSSCPVRIEKYYNPDVLNKAYSDPRSCDRNYNRKIRSFKNKNKLNDCETLRNCARPASNTVERRRSPEHVECKDEYKCSYKPQPPPLPLTFKAPEEDVVQVKPDSSKRYCCEECRYMCQKNECGELKQSDDNNICGSDYSETCECPNLVYQHTEEYLDLVNELGETLCLRNKNRVETTIREFEFLSRHNKGLEKPLFDDEDSGEPNYDNKVRCCCCNCCCRRPWTCQPPNSTRFDLDQHEAMHGRYRQHKCSKPHIDYPKYQPPRWQKDHRTGRWYKTFDESEFENDPYRPCGRTRYSSLSPPSSPHQKICNCDKCVCYNPKYNLPNDEDCRNFPAVCRCNCEYSCNVWY
ncbi:hypothetical protein FQR65_LT09984 [Abscondita terminalis]|nr:hypothetical protein FQR65_LT09984 [Abscondita terminalis]